jgi:hypothetical protein
MQRAINARIWMSERSASSFDCQEFGKYAAQASVAIGTKKIASDSSTPDFRHSTNEGG